MSEARLLEGEYVSGQSRDSGFLCYRKFVLMMRLSERNEMSKGKNFKRSSHVRVKCEKGAPSISSLNFQQFPAD